MAAGFARWVSTGAMACAACLGLLAVLTLTGCGAKSNAGFGNAEDVAKAAKMTQCSPDSSPSVGATNGVACLDAMVEWYPSPQALVESLGVRLATPGLLPDTYLSGSRWLVLCDSAATCLKYSARIGGVLSPAPSSKSSPTTTLVRPSADVRQQGIQHITAPACGRAVGAIAIVIINPDTPMPRCQVVDASQELEVVNNTTAFGMTGKAITVRWADYPATRIAPGHTVIFVGHFGQYLGGGGHLLNISLYGGGPEIYLRDATHTDGSP